MMMAVRSKQIKVFILFCFVVDCPKKNFFKGSEKQEKTKLKKKNVLRDKEL